MDLDLDKSFLGLDSCFVEGNLIIKEMVSRVAPMSRA